MTHIAPRYRQPGQGHTLDLQLYVLLVQVVLDQPLCQVPALPPMPPQPHQLLMPRHPAQSAHQERARHPGQAQLLVHLQADAGGFRNTSTGARCVWQ